MNEENTSFRSIKISGNNGAYKVTGLARVYEANFYYNVSDGHNYLICETVVNVNEGGPFWSEFSIDIRINKSDLPKFGVLILELYEKSMENNKKFKDQTFILEDFNIVNL